MDNLFLQVFKNKYIRKTIFKYVHLIHLHLGVKAYKFQQLKADYICKNKYFNVLYDKIKLHKQFPFTETCVIDFCKYNVDTNLFRLILSRYPEAFIPFSGRKSLLSDACLSGNIDIVKTLYTYANYDKTRCLLMAVRSKSTAMVQYILDLKNEEISMELEFPIDEAVVNVEILKLLYPIYLTKKSRMLKNPLEECVKKGTLDSLKYICETMGYIPHESIINQAASKGHLDMVKYIEDKYKIFCTEGACKMAIENGYYQTFVHLVKQRKPTTYEILHMAIKYQRADVLKYLLENSDAITHLHTVDLYSVFHNVEILKLLLPYPTVKLHVLQVIGRMGSYVYNYNAIPNDAFAEMVLSRSLDFDIGATFTRVIVTKCLMTKNEKVISTILSLPNTIKGLSYGDLNLLSIACQAGCYKLVDSIVKNPSQNHGLPFVTNDIYSSVFIKRDLKLLKILFENILPFDLNTNTSPSYFYRLCLGGAVDMVSFLYSSLPEGHPFLELTYNNIQSICKAQNSVGILKLLLDYKVTTIDEITESLSVQFQPKFTRWAKHYKPPTNKKK
ncbi:hypothetical protein DLAC_02827 [Tieghemostelium lacteum]|uniref:Ankyrin repeat-containing protein n=1 Tax=Tieghemostelium lacteum TaxID=361077 RepID=A0A152A3Z9_TIELA|nr:hypothetical protein DLAC_02827 [Tieghemostelium lacteum]|eukprot:KYR00781.1 hypothetical protein DLAC_02827 [Tieghemostelium lacteum]